MSVYFDRNAAANERYDQNKELFYVKIACCPNKEPYNIAFTKKITNLFFDHIDLSTGDSNLTVQCLDHYLTVYCPTSYSLYFIDRINCTVSRVQKVFSGASVAIFPVQANGDYFFYQLIKTDKLICHVGEFMNNFDYQITLTLTLGKPQDYEFRLYNTHLVLSDKKDSKVIFVSPTGHQKTIQKTQRLTWIHNAPMIKQYVSDVSYDVELLCNDKVYSVKEKM